MRPCISSVVPIALLAFSSLTGFCEGILVPESHVNFGDVLTDSVETHGFVFTNTTGSPITLSVVDKSCDCLSLDVPEDDIMPGEEAVVFMALNVNTKGRNVADAVLKVSGGSQQQLHLKLEALGRGPIFVEPEALTTVDVTVGSEGRYGIRVAAPKGAPPFLVLSVTSTVPWIATKFDTDTLSESKSEHNIDVTIAPPKTGDFKETIIIQTSDSAYAIIEIPVVTQGINEYNILPRRLDLGLVRQGERSAGRVLVTTSAVTKFAIEAIRAPADLLVNVERMNESSGNGTRRSWEVSIGIDQKAKKGILHSVVDMTVVGASGKKNIELRVTGTVQ